MKRLKIAIVDPVGIKAGMDHYDTALAEGMRKTGAHVSVYSNFANYNYSHRSFINLNGHIISKLIFLFQFAGLLLRLKLSGTKIIVIHLFHSSFIDRLLLKCLRLFRFKICVILHDAESLISGTTTSNLLNCLSLANHIVVHNQYTFDHVSSVIPDRIKNILYLIPHGHFLSLPVVVDNAEACRHFNLNLNKKNLLFFGMIKRSKGLDILIRAMKNIPPEVHLIIAGRARDVADSEVFKQVNNSGLKERVHFFNRYITNEERNELFSVCDLVIAPYRKVFQSGVILMAMSYNKPVIASDITPNKELIDGDKGFLFRTENSDDLAKQINYALAGKELLKDKTLNASKYLSENHDWDMIAGKFIKVLSP